MSRLLRRCHVAGSPQVPKIAVPRIATGEPVTLGLDPNTKLIPAIPFSCLGLSPSVAVDSGELGRLSPRFVFAEL